MQQQFISTLLLLLFAAVFAQEQQKQHVDSNTSTTEETNSTNNDMETVDGDDYWYDDDDDSAFLDVYDDDYYYPDYWNGMKSAYHCFEWNRPVSCYGEPTYDVHLHFVDGKESHFPEWLKGPLQEAAEFWSRAILGKEKNKKDGKLNSFQKLAKNVQWRAFVHRLNFYNQQRNFSSTSCDPEKDKVLKLESNSIVICVFYEDLGDGLFAKARPGGDDGSGLPMFGAIWINSKPLPFRSNCNWLGTAVHEMAHALGFTQTYLDRNVAWNEEHPIFVGPHVQREWSKLNTSLSYPPMEYRDASHWSTSIRCFQNEIMQTCSNPRMRRPLSRVTLAVFEDMGYKVNYDCADDDVELYHGQCAELVDTGLSEGKINRLKYLSRWYKKFHSTIKFMLFIDPMLLSLYQILKAL